jgi:transcription elongation factor Elf1
MKCPKCGSTKIGASKCPKRGEINRRFCMICGFRADKDDPIWEKEGGSDE